MTTNDKSSASRASDVVREGGNAAPTGELLSIILVLQSLQVSAPNQSLDQSCSFGRTTRLTVRNVYGFLIGHNPPVGLLSSQYLHARLAGNGNCACTSRN